MNTLSDDIAAAANYRDEAVLKKKINSVVKTYAGNISRLIQTESNLAVNLTTLELGKVKKLTHYVYHSVMSNATCKDCAALNGQRFPIGSAIVGINMPSMHPNCVCWITLED